MNDKAKFATKVALSLTLAYLIPFALGWPQASTAATTVMLIASTGSQRESLEKGTLRVLGTIVGAVIGLLLVGMFAQDRLLYMLCVSLVASFIFYFKNAYIKDPTLFMLTGVMTLMMSNGGDAEGAFLYGVDRAHMTVFGVIIYTLVGTYLFPSKTEQNLRRMTHDVVSLQKQILERLSPPINTISHVTDSEQASEPSSDDNQPPTLNDLIEKLYASQTALETRFSTESKECSDVSAYLLEWQLTLHYTKQITNLLIATSSSNFLQGESQKFITNYDEFVADIQQLFEQCEHYLRASDEGLEYRWQERKVALDLDSLSNHPHLSKSSAITLGYVLNRLHTSISRLTETVSCIDSITKSVSFDEKPRKSAGAFLWWDAENFKTSIKVFVTYWVAAFIWIFFNPPGGYSFVIFSTIFVSLLSFLPVHPKLLGFLFTFGFIFAVPAYVFVLPTLELGIELALFLFAYTFIGFYLFKGPITIFFMIGLFILGIDNVMNYHFGILLTIMMLFYLVVLMLVFAHYFPFSSKAERLFLLVRQRLFTHVYHLVVKLQTLNHSPLTNLAIQLHLKTANVAAKKLTLWANKIDLNYFDKNDHLSLTTYTKQCRNLTDHLNTLIIAQTHLKNNPLITKLRNEYTDESLLTLIRTHNRDQRERVQTLEDVQCEYAKTEAILDVFFQQLDPKQYAQKDIAEFYIFLSLKRSVFESLIKAEEAAQNVDLDNLKMHRF